MSQIDVWIQIENHAWDVCPNNIDRMTGQTLQQITTTPTQNVTLTSRLRARIAATSRCTCR